MELYRALGALIEAPSPGHERIARALGLPAPPDGVEHASEITFQRYPYASVYLGSEGMMGGDARSRIAGFWLALGLEVPHEPDHLTALLSLVSSLEEGEASAGDARAALLREARRTLLWEHVISWTTPYLVSFASADSAYYRGWARLLAGALAEGMADLGGPPDHLPPALGALQPLGDPRSPGAGKGDADFLRALLAPGRSGLVVLRSDLAEAARALGLALRAGERHYVLSSLMAQDPGGTLSWLHGFSQAWCERLEAQPEGSMVQRWWAQRAGHTADLLGLLAADPDVLQPLAS